MNKDISKEEFESLPAHLQRMLIAKDVIAQIACGKMIPEKSSFLLVNCSFDEIDKNTRLDQVLENKVCHVCGIGAAFVSLVGFVDGEETNKHLRYIGQGRANSAGGNLRNKLSKLFEQRQLDLIEVHFECWGDCVEIYPYNPKVRLTMIMQNIIDNNGTFVPPTQPVGIHA